MSDGILINDAAGPPGTEGDGKIPKGLGEGGAGTLDNEDLNKSEDKSSEQADDSESSEVESIAHVEDFDDKFPDPEKKAAVYISTMVGKLNKLPAYKSNLLDTSFTNEVRDNAGNEVHKFSVLSLAVGANLTSSQIEELVNSNNPNAKLFIEAKNKIDKHFEVNENLSLKEAQKNLFNAVDRFDETFNLSKKEKNIFLAVLGNEINKDQKTPENKEKDSYLRFIFMTPNTVKGVDADKTNLDRVNPNKIKSAYLLREELLSLEDEPFKDRFGDALAGRTVESVKKDLLKAQKEDLSQHMSDKDKKLIPEVLKAVAGTPIDINFDNDSWAKNGWNQIKKDWNSSNDFLTFGAKTTENLMAVPFDAANVLLKRIAKALEAEGSKAKERAAADETLSRLTKAVNIREDEKLIEANSNARDELLNASTSSAKKELNKAKESSFVKENSAVTNTINQLVDDADKEKSKYKTARGKALTGAKKNLFQKQKIGSIQNNNEGNG